ncbi:hypothetical protein [Blastococcus sp. SYSU D00813]
MSPERAAAVANTERAIADRLEHLGVDEPADAAARLVKWLQSRGWRVHPELASDLPTRPRTAPPAVAKAALAEARAAVAAKRGSRPEAQR